MNKLFILLFIVITFFISSCADINLEPPPDIGVQVALSDSEISQIPLATFEIASTIEPKKLSYDEYMQVIIDNAMNGISGEVLSTKYIVYADLILNQPDTFTWIERIKELDECIQEYEKIYKNETGFKTSRPPVLYYITQKMGITREEIEKYNEVLETNIMPQELVDGLFVKDVSEAMQIFKSPFAFYADGNVYNIYELMQLSDAKVDSLNIADYEFIKTAELITQYLNSESRQGYNDNDTYREFLERSIAKRKMRNETVIETITIDEVATEFHDVCCETEECVHSVYGMESSYHDLLYDYVEYVGRENFDKWLEEAFKISESINSPDCKFSYCNIYNFIKDFNIPREVFEDIYNKSVAYYLRDYNIDILYCGDINKIEEYYRTGETRQEEMTKRSNEYSDKSSFISYVEKTYGETAYEIWVQSKKNYQKDIPTVLQWSIPEIINKFNIPDEFVIEVLSEGRKVTSSDGKEYVESAYKYDIDKILDGKRDSAFKEQLSKAESVLDYRRIDESLRIDYDPAKSGLYHN